MNIPDSRVENFFSAFVLSKNYSRVVGLFWCNFSMPNDRFGQMTAIMTKNIVWIENDV
jgi:hypothetical protein